MASLSRLRNFTTLILSATLLYGFFMLTPAAESETGTAASPSSVLKSRVLFVLMCQSQAASFHKQRCDLLRRHIEDQAKELKVPAGAETPDISIALAEDLVDPGIETFFYLPILAGNHTQLTQSDFVFFCHEETRMNLVGLLNQLAQYNSSKPLFIGSPLRDEGYYIVHHFSQSRHLYPFVYCGFAMSNGLITSLVEHFQVNKAKLGEYEFRIDPAYELASLISIELHLANLTALSAMCPRSVNLTDSCITWTTEMFRLPQCFPNSSAVSAVLNRTLFAVKTHQANFATVLSVVRDTWAKEAPNIIYYADVEDREIPTVACGVPNTERGHCDKLNRILHLLAESNNVSAQATNNADGSDKSNSSSALFDWFVVCDDDTLLSPSRLARLLACHSLSQPADSPLVVGEKYGYLSADGRHGYPYPTGGSGFALNRAALRRLTVEANGAGGIVVTRCGSAESPDDMSLGVWLRSLSVPIVHSHLLHQAKPVEYSPVLLRAQLPISFHKHLDLDPRQAYRDWLLDAGTDAASKPDVGSADDHKRDEL
ncbi:hypothetical protein BOX15_Mlig010101g2 [Macrostomum lignano]|uniref:N-acetylgalactosaminide beta-1,3-galactosyltransferase n=1 Tax=Macrostomum lignano TaxID=282301 RepID=A0A267GZ28_9PLAT|nr:hypothetical protein BOX15_Mlig010101g2 [Macrostomum lignano]